MSTHCRWNLDKILRNFPLNSPQALPARVSQERRVPSGGVPLDLPFILLPAEDERALLLPTWVRAMGVAGGQVPLRRKVGANFFESS